MSNATLTDKQEKFVQELIKGKSQREAYRAVYPNSVQWTDKSVDERASKLLANAKVNTRYNTLRDRLIKESEDECIVSAKDVLRELTKVAFANGSDFAKVVEKTGVKTKVNEYGEKEEEEYIYSTVEIKNTDELEESKKAAISCIKETKFGIAVETCDKVKALELLGKHLKLFTDKQEVEHSGAVNIVDDL